jgi:plastocyanin
MRPISQKRPETGPKIIMRCSAASLMMSVATLARATSSLTRRVEPFHVKFVVTVVRGLAFFALIISCDTHVTKANDAHIEDAIVVDASDAPDLSDSASDANEAEAADLPLNGCKDSDFVDRKQPMDDRAIAWTYTVSPACITIAKDQSVTWNGNLMEHPLEARGGETNTPITPTGMGTSVAFGFSNVGDYGFGCQNHPFMTGVVRVVP